MDLTAVEEDVFSGYLAGFTSLAGGARTRGLGGGEDRLTGRQHGHLPPRIAALLRRPVTR